MDVNGSVIKEPPQFSSPGTEYIFYLATVADDMPAWGSNPIERDRKLREFWPSEPILASALYSTAARYAGFQWTLKGPERQVNIVNRVFRGSEQGKGWTTLMLKTLVDLFSQDNGAFIEIVRTSNSSTAPCIQLNHLDAGRCIRTGRAEEPVVYYDRIGVPHYLKWYQVVTLEEFPSPQESMFGMQYCAVTRLLRSAQILRDISIYKREKIGGRFNRAIHLVSGIHQKALDNAIREKAADADAQGLIRYVNPIVIGSLDPTANVKVATIELASLPDSFNEDTNMKWYVNQLALAFGGDYQDFAPLPAGNLGTSEQSETLHLKSRGKGPRLFMQLGENIINNHGIIPATVNFTYGEQDIAETIETAQLRKLRAEERKIRLDSGEITPEIARQLANDAGDLDGRYIESMGEPNITEDIKIKL